MPATTASPYLVPYMVDIAKPDPYTITHKQRTGNHDTMRPEHDFSQAVRGATAARYTQSANVVVIDPDILDMFPTGESVNEALRALAPVLRRNRKAVARRQSA